MRIVCVWKVFDAVFSGHAVTQSLQDSASGNMPWTELPTFRMNSRHALLKQSRTLGEPLCLATAVLMTHKDRDSLAAAANSLCITSRAHFISMTATDVSEVYINLSCWSFMFVVDKGEASLRLVRIAIHTLPRMVCPHTDVKWTPEIRSLNLKLASRKSLPCANITDKYRKKSSD